MTDKNKNPERNFKRWAAAVMALAVLAVSFLAGYFTHYMTLQKEVKTFRWVMETIRKNYYGETSGQELLDAALDALIYELDPYYQYYSAQEYKEILSERQGKRIGVGISVFGDADVGNLIVAVSGNSPAEKAGIRAGYSITGIGKNTENIEALSDSSLIFEKIGAFSENEEFYLRLSDGKLYAVSRQEYDEGFVYYADAGGYYGYSIEGSKDAGLIKLRQAPPELSAAGADVGYIKLTSFSGDAAAQFAGALSKFRENKKTKLILDLRLNGGGYMDILINITSHLIYSNDAPLYAAVAKNKAGKSAYYSVPASYYKLNNFSGIAVLANGSTASASECLIGAMLDYGTLSANNLFISEYAGNERAATYGKGVMQTTYTQNTGGAALKLTTAGIYWPLSGTSIHQTGISGVAVPTHNYKIISAAADNELAAAVNALAA